MKTYQELKLAVSLGLAFRVREREISGILLSTFEVGTRRVYVIFKGCEGSVPVLINEIEVSNDLESKTKQELLNILDEYLCVDGYGGSVGEYFYSVGGKEETVKKLWNFIQKPSVHYNVYKSSWMSPKAVIDYYSDDYSVEERIQNLMKTYSVKRDQIVVTFEGRVEEIRDKDLESASRWFNELKERM